MEPSGIERFAVEQALYSAIGSDLKTGRADNLRGEVDAHYRALNAQTGADRFRVSAGGTDAGTYRFDHRSGKDELAVTDWDDLASWDDPDFLEFCGAWVRSHLDRLAREFFEETGVVPDGMELTRTPDELRGVYVPDRGLVSRVRAQIDGGIAGLLEGGQSH